jgi:hypothetical protein
VDGSPLETVTFLDVNMTMRPLFLALWPDSRIRAFSQGGRPLAKNLSRNHQHWPFIINKLNFSEASGPESLDFGHIKTSVRISRDSFSEVMRA